MNLFTVIGIVGVSMAIVTLIFAITLYRLSAAVVQNQADIENSSKRYQPNVTAGFNIPVQEDKSVQFKEARIEAAKRAASLPRGANLRIGRRGAERLQTASANLKNDPVSALKIAEVQGWQGLGEFDRYQQAATATAAAPVAVATGPQVKRKLVAGKDFEVTAISDSMSGGEKRTARIANAKAKAAAYKALKEAGADMVAAAPAAAPAAAAPAAPPVPSAADVGIAEPELIEITDGMDPAEVRRARIANAKAMSAYKKALKAAGVTPGAAAPAAAAPPPAPAAAPPPPPASEPAGLASIPKPDLIEITDDMDPAAIRQARIANSKAKSAYKKALKAAGIDPKSVKI
ncbi:MAG: hypothetical protein QNJ45_18280 [Ardenticatenaceae bacterium]|nr:hypothetical protein [Ardenticatenaceae bacterium]